MKIKIAYILFVLAASMFALDGAGFSGFSGSKQQKFLQPSEAFKAAVQKDGDKIKVNIKLGDKIYIYKKDLHFKVTSPENFELSPALPKAQIHGKDEIFHDISVDIPMKSISNRVDGDFNVTIEMTGCSDGGICYLPQKRTFKFAQDKESSQGLFSKISSLISSGNAGKISDVLASGNLFFVLLLFFIAGLLLALTPCILPMVPILSSIILQQGNKDGKINRGKSFTISLVYVVSMALTYALIGVVAGLFKFDLAANMNNPWVVIPFAGLFVALALSLFGLYELALPSSWQSKIMKASDNAQGKGFVGTAIMGSLSALIVGACTAPVISGAVAFIASTGDAVLGGISLFIMGLGAGMPLLLIGVGADRLVPKPGGWMTGVSQLFGVSMLMVALYILSRLLPPSVTMLLSSVLLIGISIYMGTFDSKRTRDGFVKLFTLFGVMIFLYGTILFVGFASGSTSLTNPLDRFTQVKSATLKKTNSDKADEKSSRLGYTLERLQNEIESAGKPVVVDIGKDGCAACLELENITFADAKVKEEFKRFKFIQVDITKYTEGDKAIMDKYNIFGAPNILFFDSSSKPLNNEFLTGYIPPESFLKKLKTIK